MPQVQHPELQQARARLETESAAARELTATVAKWQAHVDWLTAARPNLPGSLEYRQHDDAMQGAPKNLLRAAMAALATQEAAVRAAQEEVVWLEHQAADQAATVPKE
ncbi:MAG: hypothetical protein JWP65_657 [Ramlibacter sp.]|uniref:hypothetical protein n=1 Tax=Ramlibacter sp. TaxID=1917967 RepID=UPI00263218C6|nr:hypothetical protein [Ramlibacter sp.]MDB5750236.1 hypothetical protein [Ramlibacter sp.]